MSTNKRSDQHTPHSESDTESPWEGNARDAWVSMAVAAATASLREATTASGEVADLGTDSDFLQ